MITVLRKILRGKKKERKEFRLINGLTRFAFFSTLLVGL
jgi:hypothetical protein